MWACVALQVYKLRDNKTAIVALTEFDTIAFGPFPSPDGYTTFVSEIIKAFATANE